MRPPFLFDTPHLRLRLPTRANAAVLFTQYAQDPEVTQYLGWPPPRTLEATHAFVQGCLAAWDQGTAFS
jgi:[ribosomal protein S5]-alanine N-acetyltransferase